MRVSGNGIVETRVVVRNPGQYNQLCCRAPIGWEWDIVVTVSFWATGLNRSPYRDLVSWVLRDQKGAFCLLQFWASHSLSLPPPPHGADGASIFFSFSFTFTFTFAFTVIATTQQSIHCTTVSHACFNSLFPHLHWANFTVDWYQYRHDEFPKRKREKEKTYMYHHVSLSLVPSGCTGWRDWNFTQYIYVVRIVGFYFSLSFLYSIYLIFNKKINVVCTES